MLSSNLYPGGRLLKSRWLRAQKTYRDLDARPVRLAGGAGC